MTSLSYKIRNKFIKRFDREPILIESPGRVNLIGEHTDYNDGFVLPAAIDKRTVMAISANNLSKFRAYALDMKEEEIFELNDLHVSKKHWANYLKGVVAELQVAEYQPKGFDVVFGGDIPIGAGLSSSAALEGALLVGLDHLFDFKLNRKKMARLGQLTEHNHIGVQCGIMDQYINLHGEANKALKLDCRSLDYKLYPFDRDDIKIVLCNSKVSHNLANSEYNVRRSQCEQGVETLKKFYSNIENLRDVSTQMLNEYKKELGEQVYQRCKFVIDENQRVLDACIDLDNNDFETFGRRMFASHNGLSKEYEVSCSELDILVEIAREQSGIFDTRMMGGGFEDCTINLVQEDHVAEFTHNIYRQYKSRTGLETEIYVTQINQGARVTEKI
jgi:galactokinase